MNILVIGGAGYVGCRLIPALLADGHHVVVHDVLLFGDHLPKDQNLTVIKGDARLMPPTWFNSMDVVIHLAWIPDGFEQTVLMAKEAGIRRFIFVSSSAVYGIPDAAEVDENSPTMPITHYNTYKAECERFLLKQRGDGFERVVLRPCTICGYSPRQRFDLLLNSMVNQAFVLGKITIVGGQQMRPSLDISDLVDAIMRVMVAPAKLVDGEIFNIGARNLSILNMAHLVAYQVAGTKIERSYETIDTSSYQVNSNKIIYTLGIEMELPIIISSIGELHEAFRRGLLPNSLTDDRYYNDRRPHGISEIDLHRMGKKP